MSEYKSFDLVDTRLGEQVKAVNEETGRSRLFSHEEFLDYQAVKPPPRPLEEVASPPAALSQEPWTVQGRNEATGETILKRPDPAQSSGYELRRVAADEAEKLLRSTPKALSDQEESPTPEPTAEIKTSIKVETAAAEPAKNELELGRVKEESTASEKTPERTAGKEIGGLRDPRRVLEMKQKFNKQMLAEQRRRNKVQDDERLDDIGSYAEILRSDLIEREVNKWTQRGDEAGERRSLNSKIKRDMALMMQLSYEGLEEMARVVQSKVDTQTAPKPASDEEKKPRPKELVEKSPELQIGDMVSIFIAPNRTSQEHLDRDWKVIKYRKGKRGQVWVDVSKGDQKRTYLKEKLEWWQSLDPYLDEAERPHSMRFMNAPQRVKVSGESTPAKNNIEENEESTNGGGDQPPPPPSSRSDLETLHKLAEELKGDPEVSFGPGEEVRAFSLYSLSFEDGWRVQETFQRGGQTYVRINKEQNGQSLTKEVREGELEAWQADDLLRRRLSAEEAQDLGSRSKQIWRGLKELRLRKIEDPKVKKLLIGVGLGTLVLGLTGEVPGVVGLIGVAGTVPGIAGLSYLARRHYEMPEEDSPTPDDTQSDQENA